MSYGYGWAWEELLLKKQTLRDKVVQASKSGNFDELLENHNSAQLRRAVNTLVDDGMKEERFQPLLDKLGTAKRADGKDNPEYERPNEKEVEMYESFMNGNHEELVEFLNDGTDGNKRVKISRLIKWNSENGDALLKYVKDKPELYGYITKDITLTLPNNFDRDILDDYQFVMERDIKVTLPEFLTIEQGKALAGGQPSQPIERTAFARIFKAPEYKDKIVATSVKLEASTIDGGFAADYLNMVVTNLRGNTREPFMPTFSVSEAPSSGQIREAQKLFFGAKTGGGTSRMYPAMEYILRNEKLDLDVGFVRTQTKETLQEVELANKFQRAEIDDKELNKLYNKFVKVKTDEDGNVTNVTGYSKFKQAVVDAGLEDDYNKFLKETQVRRYTLPVEVRDALVAMIDNEADEKQVRLVKSKLGHLFSKVGFKRSVREMRKKKINYGDPDKIKEALLSMEEKAEGTVSITDKLFLERVNFLFDDVDQDPLGNFLSGMDSGGKFRLKDMQLSSKQVLQFSDLLVMVLQLSRKMLRDSKLQMSLKRLLRETDSKKRKEAEDEFKTKLSESYSKIHKGVLDAIRRKMVQVMEEPLLHNKSGAIQPYDWINENRS